jgi:hypothetical protein
MLRHDFAVAEQRDAAIPGRRIDRQDTHRNATRRRRGRAADQPVTMREMSL